MAETHIHEPEKKKKHIAQIQQVIMNLCTNAYHAMGDAPGVLTVGLSEIEVSELESIPDLNRVTGKYLKLEIKDTGHGMDPKIMERIFDPYFTTKKVGKGTGLGLAVVDGILKNHQGFIKAFSQKGQGSTFQVFLPITEQAESEKVPEKKKLPLSMGTEQIMLVDDEVDILVTLEEILERLGYRMTGFKDGVSAFQAFEKDPDLFDLIITDMTMPRMTGDELSAQVLKIRKNMPIILCTGFHENFTEALAREMGIRKYAEKPIMIQELSALIREILDNKGE